MFNDTLKRVLHLIFTRNPETREFQYALKTPRQPGDGKTGRTRFDVHEVSPFYEEFCPVPYIQATWDLNEIPVPTKVNPEMRLSSVTRAIDCISHGIGTSTVGMDLPDFVKRFGEWKYFVDGSVREHIQALFTRDKITERDMGIESDVDTLEDAGRRMKYSKGTTAPAVVRHGQPVAHRGKVISLEESARPYGKRVDFTVEFSKPHKWTANMVLHQIDKSHPWHVIYDGMNFASDRGMDLGWGMANSKVGKIVRPRALGPKGINHLKGLQMHANIEPDFVWINSKKQLRFIGNDFYMFLMADVHGTEAPYYDLQSLYNFYNIGNGPAIFKKDAEAFFGEMMDLVQNHELWHERFMHMAQDADNPGNWLPLALAELDIYNVFPAAFRSQVGMVAEPVRKSRLGRIPMSQAYRRYITCPPDAIQPDGELNPDNTRLKGHCVGAYNVPEGKIVLTPQPNGNPNAHFVTDVVDVPWKSEDGWFFSPEIMQEHHVKLEGRDNDDPEIGRIGLEVVTHFERDIAGLYPMPKALVPTETVVIQDPRNTKYFNRIKRDTLPNQWSHRNLQQHIKLVINQITIGLVSNPIMADNAISIGKPFMLNRLADQVDRLAGIDTKEADAQRTRLIQAFVDLEELPQWRLLDISSNLEEWIDRIKMKGSVDNNVRERFDEFWHSTPVFPSSLKISRNLERGRIPESVMKEDDPLFVDTPICEALGSLDEDIRAFEEAAVEVENLLVRPLPKELIAKYPTTDEVHGFVSELRSWTYGWWAERRELWGGIKPDAEALKEALNAFNDAQSDILLESPVFNERPEAVWVDYANRIYDSERATAMVDEDGRGQHVPDAAIWTILMRMAAIQAFQGAGLTGVVAILHPLTGVRVPRRAKVRVEASQVRYRDNGKALGMAKAPDGEYEMIGRYIRIKPCHPALKAGWDLYQG